MKILSNDHVAKMLGLGLKEPGAEATVPTSVITAPDPLREHAEKTWPAKDGHKAGCSAYYSLENCECQSPNWKPSSAGNYPSEPNP